jgi:N6-adenosine-specific RNA methylase IME4
MRRPEDELRRRQLRLPFNVADCKAPTSWPFGSLQRAAYAVILCDPPWRFVTWSAKGQTRAAANHYDVMRLEDIKRLPVVDLAADDCALFLWAINPMLPQALAVMDAWGFTYKTVAFTWAKTTPGGKWHLGLGYWTRANSELCLLATRGKPKRLAKDVRQLIISVRREHSRKPDEIAASIERLVGGRRCELFARHGRPGWDQWGAEIQKFDRSHHEPPPLAARSRDHGTSLRSI